MRTMSPRERAAMQAKAPLAHPNTLRQEVGVRGNGLDQLLIAMQSRISRSSKRDDLSSNASVRTCPRNYIEFLNPRTMPKTIRRIDYRSAAECKLLAINPW